MSLFRCEKCNHIENTATSNYWLSDERLCSLCDPKIGKWHNLFPRRLYDSKKDIIKNPNIELGGDV